MGWPASGPFVTGVGGTYLCTNPVTGTGIDSAGLPTNCQTSPRDQRDRLDRFGPRLQPRLRHAQLPGHPVRRIRRVGAIRGVPDVAYQASFRTGVLVYDTAPGDAEGGLACPNDVADARAVRARCLLRPKLRRSPQHRVGARLLLGPGLRPPRLRLPSATAALWLLLGLVLQLVLFVLGRLGLVFLVGLLSLLAS